MNELLRRDLYTLVNAYLRGRLSRRHLEEWLLQSDSLLMQEPASEVARLAGLIDLGIVEISRGHMSEDEFKEEIRNFLGQQNTIVLWASVGEQRAVTVTTSGSTVVHGAGYGGSVGPANVVLV